LPAIGCGDAELYDLRSREARQFLKERNVQFITMNTIYCIKGDKVSKKSTAVFNIFRHARSPYRYLSLLGILPVAFTDYFYDLVAKHRYTLSKLFFKKKLNLK
jgi:predicted DCC family thiol-disulfide oxidoreductase YuxK